MAKEYIVTVVDDDNGIRESIKDLLASAGLETRLFSSAEEVLRGDDLDASCCLITDVRMPGMDGWELQRRVVKRFPHLAIIFITAFQDDAARRRAFELGASAFLYKPFDGNELLETVEATIH